MVSLTGNNEYVVFENGQKERAKERDIVLVYVKVNDLCLTRLEFSFHFLYSNYCWPACGSIYVFRILICMSMDVNAKV